MRIFILLAILFFMMLSVACNSSDDSTEGSDGDVDSELESLPDGDASENMENSDTDAPESDGDLDGGEPALEEDTEAEGENETEPEAETPARLYVASGGAIQTEDEHVLYLRGVNISGESKYSADHLFNLTQQDIETLLASGINSARLLTFWKALMPEGPENIDQTYIEAYMQRVQMLSEAGIYVIADMHQDLWGVPFVTHGAPDWACPEEIKAGYEPKDPWWLNYTTPQVKGCFDNFYADTELQDAFVRAWAALAQAMCEDEMVLGFDLWNEPFPGSRIGDAEFDNEVLWPLYRKTLDAIEEICPGRLYFIEPSAAVVPADPFVFPPELLDRLVIAPHFYPSYIHESNAEGYTIGAEELAADITDAFGEYLESEVPVWIGEFGGITDNPNFDIYMQDLHGIFMRNLIPSAYWDYYAGEGGFAFLDSTRTLKTELQPVYTAPLPFEFPARPDVFEADFQNGVIEASFNCQPGKHVKVLLGDDNSSCESQMPQILEFSQTQSAGFIQADCLSDGQVEIICSKNISAN